MPVRGVCAEYLPLSLKSRHCDDLQDKGTRLTWMGCLLQVLSRFHQDLLKFQLLRYMLSQGTVRAKSKIFQWVELNLQIPRCFQKVALNKFLNLVQSLSRAEQKFAPTGFQKKASSFEEITSRSVQDTGLRWPISAWRRIGLTYVTHSDTPPTNQIGIPWRRKITNTWTTSPIHQVTDLSGKPIFESKLTHKKPQDPTTIIRVVSFFIIGHY